MDNYQISRDRAQRYFLGFDQEKIIRDWNLKHNEKYLYVTFLGREYGICRESGAVTRLWDGAQAGYEEALSIFDLLCHQAPCKQLAGSYAPVNSLKGSPVAGGVGTDFYGKTAARFDRNPEAFRRACLQLGSEVPGMGDMGFRFPVFSELSVLLKFYCSDEEFPASITLLYDENTLQFLYYETVFYVGGFLLGEILRTMEALQQGSCTEVRNV